MLWDIVLAAVLLVAVVVVVVVEGHVPVEPVGNGRLSLLQDN